MKKALYLFHRKLAPWLALPVALWAFSGLLHPMMANWFRPEIARTFLPPLPIPQSKNLLPPGEVFSDFPRLHQLKIIALKGQPVLLGITPDQELHFRDGLTGEPIPEATQAYAEQLARSYADDFDSSLLEIQKITAFGPTYSSINRLLPVYRVRLERADGLEVVVDPRTGRLATFDTPSKRLFTRLFSWFHTWSFLGSNYSPLRITVVLLVSSLTLLLAITGLASLFFIKRKKTNSPRSVTRKWHRISGTISATFFFLFGISGIAHVAMKYRNQDPTQWVSAQSAPTSQLGSLKGPLAKASLAVIDGKPHYRIQNHNGVEYHSTKDGSILPNGDEIFARHLALEFSGFPDNSIVQTEEISSFRKDYGFIFKRLPVWRVSYTDQSHWNDTVDTEDAHMAMQTSALTLTESLSFIFLHKFHFLDFAGRDARDAGSAIAVILILITIVFGLLAMKRRTKKNSTAE